MVIELRHQQHEIGWLKGDREECKAALQTFSDFLEMKAEATDAEQDRRRAQSGAEPEGDAGYVHIFKRRMSSPHLSGRVDESNGGRRLSAFIFGPVAAAALRTGARGNARLRTFFSL